MSELRNNNTIDEFGRDITLRKSSKPNQKPNQNPKMKNYNVDEISPVTREIFELFKGKSWAEVEWELEEEEEKNNLNTMIQNRNNQWIMGEYDLEEGELLE